MTPDDSSSVVRNCEPPVENRAGSCSTAVLRGVASEATLYVNDFNTPAIATYEAVGFRRVGTFATILL